MQDAGMEIPALDNRPSITGFEWLWEAFLELNTCRETGMGIGSIPWTASQNYAEALRMNDEEAWLMHKVVRHLDGLFVDHYSKKSNDRS